MAAAAGSRTSTALPLRGSDKPNGAAATAAGTSEHKQFDPSLAHTAHLVQVETDLTRIFNGLGSPVSNEVDRMVAASLNASLMFGEILFNGVSRILDAAHLHAAAPGTRTLYDLGSGCGRLCVQAFLQFTNLEKVVGVELTSVRSKVGFAALTRMNKTPPKGYEGRVRLSVTSRGEEPHYTLAVAPATNARSLLSVLTGASAGAFAQPSCPRTLELVQGNLFDCTGAWNADILICETNIDPSMHYDFLHFLAHCQPGARLLTYNSLEQMHEDVCGAIDNANNAIITRSTAERKSVEQLVKPPFPWRRLTINTWEDKFSASWGMIHFHLYTRQPDPPAKTAAGEAATASAMDTVPGRRDSLRRASFTPASSTAMERSWNGSAGSTASSSGVVGFFSDSKGRGSSDDEDDDEDEE